MTQQRDLEIEIEVDGATRKTHRGLPPKALCPLCARRVPVYTPDGKVWYFAPHRLSRRSQTPCEASRWLAEDEEHLMQERRR